MSLFYLNGEAQTALVDVPHANRFQRIGKKTPVFGLYSPALGDVFDPATDAMPVIISGVEDTITLNVDNVDFASLGQPGDEAWDGEGIEASGIAIAKFAALTQAAIWARLGDGSAKVVLEAGDADIGRIGMQQQLVIDADVALGADISGAVDLGFARLVAIQLPAGWEGTALKFDVSHDGVTYAPLYGEAGAEKTLIVAESRYVVCNPADFLGVRRLKVRASVVQAAARTLRLIAQP